MRLAHPSEIGEIVAVDDDSAVLYGEHGLPIELTADHPFVLAERTRWLAGAEDNRVFVVDAAGEIAGFAALDRADGEPYLDQLSVRRRDMGRGLGSALIERAVRWATEDGGRHVWLTTYAHLPFNRPFYERRGFRVVPERECGPDVRRYLDEQRRVLPAPSERVAMRRALPAPTHQPR